MPTRDQLNQLSEFSQNLTAHGSSEYFVTGGGIDVSIVLPVYNEEDSMEELYEKLTAVMTKLNRSYELIYIDDGSQDKSVEVIKRVTADDAHARLVILRRNFGQTPALAAGFDAACGKIIVAMDSDLQHNPEEIPKFLEKIDEGYDVVSGWREKRVDNLFIRRIPSLIANRLMKHLSGVDLHDFGTTFKAYRAEVIKKRSALRRASPIHSRPDQCRRCENLRSSHPEHQPSFRQEQLRH